MFWNNYKIKKWPFNPQIQLQSSFTFFRPQIPSFRNCNYTWSSHAVSCKDLKQMIKGPYICLSSLCNNITVFLKNASSMALRMAKSDIWSFGRSDRRASKSKQQIAWPHWAELNMPKPGWEWLFREERNTLAQWHNDHFISIILFS